MHSSKGPKWRIILVDDDLDICMTLELGLKQNGLYVAAFSDPQVALARFEAGLFDLALLDVRMPKLSGFNLYIKLRERDPQLKVCFLTAFEAFNEFTELFPALASRHFLKKPVGIKMLVARVEEILENGITRKDDLV